MTTRDELARFLDELNFSQEETSETLNIFDRIQENEEARRLFDSYYIPFKEKHELDFDSFVQNCLPKVTELTGIHRYKVNLSLCAALAPHSKYFYDKLGLDYKIWRDSLMDIKWKLRETLACAHMIGTFSSSWFKSWYFAKRLIFHRLQFELVSINEDYKSENFDLKAGDPVIGVHIHSTREIKFDKENRDISFDIARKYFATFFNGKPVVFRCHSWLLAPYHTKILPESSNIRSFAEEFEIVKCNEPRADLWRIFNIEAEKIPEDKDLPEDTELQRIYKKFMLDGGTPCAALGYRY